MSVNINTNFDDTTQLREWYAIVKDNEEKLAEAVNDGEAAADTHKKAAVIDHPDASVTAAKLAAGSVTTAKLANGSVTAEKLSAASVTTEKLAAGSVTTEKLGAGAVGVNNVSEAVWATINGKDEAVKKLIDTHKKAAVIDHPDGSVTAAKLAAGSVTTEKLAGGSVTTEKLSAEAVGADNLSGELWDELDDMCRKSGLYPCAYELSSLKDNGVYRFTLPADELMLLTIDVISSNTYDGGSKDQTWSYLLYRDDVKYNLVGGEKLAHGATYLCKVTQEPKNGADIVHGELTVYASLGKGSIYREKLSDSVKSSIIYTAVCTTESTASVKTVTTETGDFKLKDGAVINILLSYSFKPLGGGVSLNVDGVGEVAFKPNGIDPYDTITYNDESIIWGNAYLPVVCIGEGDSLDGWCFALLDGVAAKLLDRWSGFFKDETRYVDLSQLSDAIDRKADKANITYISGAETVSTLTPDSGKEYRFQADMKSISISLPSSVPDDFEAYIVFSSGETATAITYPDDMMWSGDDVIDGVFTPLTYRRYNIGIWSDGDFVNAVVRGVSV